MSAKKRPPADTPQGREDQLISLAYDLVEQRLLDGTATAAETTLLIKAGTQREVLERQRIQNENLLLSARVEDIASGQRLEGLVGEALAAFRRYSPEGAPEEEEDEGYLYEQY